MGDPRKLHSVPVTLTFGDDVGYFSECSLFFTKDRRYAYRAAAPSTPYKSWIVGYIPSVTADLWQQDSTTFAAIFGHLAAGTSAEWDNSDAGERYDDEASAVKKLSITPLYGADGPTLNIYKAEGSPNGAIVYENAEIQKLPVIFEALGDWDEKIFDYTIAGSGGEATYARQSTLTKLQTYIKANYSKDCFIVPEPPENRLMIMRHPGFFINVRSCEHDSNNPEISIMTVDIHVYQWSPGDPFGQQSAALVNAYLTLMTKAFKSIKELIDISLNGKVISTTGSIPMSMDSVFLQKGTITLQILVNETG